MVDQIPVGAPEKQYSGNVIIAVLAVATLFIVYAMFQFGSQALRMGPQAKELNRLMHERTLACAEPVDIDKCRAATEAADAYGIVMEEAVHDPSKRP